MRTTGRITASASTPGIWPIVVIEAGRSINGRVYPSNVLREATERGIFEGVTVAGYSKIDANGNPVEDHVSESHIGMSVLNAVGKTRNTRWSESEQAVVGELHLSLGQSGADAYESDLQAHAANGNLDIPGLSIDAYADVEPDGVTVRAFENCVELTIVTHPSAGGRFASHRIAASVSGDAMTDFQKLLKHLRESYGSIVGVYVGPESEGALERHIGNRLLESAESRAACVTALNAGAEKFPRLREAISVSGGPANRITEDVDLMQLLDEAALLVNIAREHVQKQTAKAVASDIETPPAVEAATTEPEPAPAAPPAPAPEPVQEGVPPTPTPTPVKESAMDKQAKKDAAFLAERAKAERVKLSHDNIREAVREAKLGDSVATMLIEQSGDAEVTRESASAMAERQRKTIDDAIRESVNSGPVVVREAQDRQVEALAHMFSPRRCKAPAEGAYEHGMSVKAFIEDQMLGRRHRLSEAYNGQSSRVRLREAIDETSMANVFSDALSRSLAAEYGGLENYNAWRQIVDTVPRSDFREHNVISLGYYGLLPTVGKGQPYLRLTTPADREESIQLAKKGGTEAWTLEDALNDDIGMIQAMIRRIARSSAEGRQETCMALIRKATQPTMADGYKLTDQSRTPANEKTVALTADETGKQTYEAAERQMQEGTGGSGQPKGTMASFMVIPLALRTPANYILQALMGGNTGTDLSTMASRFGMPIPKPIIDRGATDVNDWFLMADPTEAPVIQYANLNGRDEPEIFLADGQTFGSLFTNDQVEMKVRDIYAFAAVDFLGIQGNAVT